MVKLWFPRLLVAFLFSSDADGDISWVHIHGGKWALASERCGQIQVIRHEDAGDVYLAASPCLTRRGPFTGTRCPLTRRQRSVAELGPAGVSPRKSSQDVAPSFSLFSLLLPLHRGALTCSPLPAPQGWSRLFPQLPKAPFQARLTNADS